MRSAYNVGMSNVQYTIRSIPDDTDAYLRRQAKLHGRSLNTIVLGYLENAIKHDKIKKDDDFSWLIGSNTIDDASLKTIKAMKEYDKQKQRR
jgi:plasmid stability protein